MGPRLSPHDLPGSLDGQPPLPARASQSSPGKGVLSVSPHHAGSELPAAIGETGSEPHSVQDVAGVLQSLIEKARGVSQEIAQVIQQASDCQAQANESAVLLQERLRLSAQVLKASQVQITGVETSMAELRELEDRIQSGQARLEQRLAAFESRLTVAVGREVVRPEAVPTVSAEDIDPDGLVCELTGLSSAMRGLAERITQLAALRPPPKPTPAAAPAEIEPREEQRGGNGQAAAPTLEFQTWAVRAGS